MNNTGSTAVSSEAISSIASQLGISIEELTVRLSVPAAPIAEHIAGSLALHTKATRRTYTKHLIRLRDGVGACSARIR